MPRATSSGVDVAVSKAPKAGETPATTFLRRHGAVFSTHVYEYVERGGALGSAAALGLEPHTVVKTLVMQDDKAAPLIILMHGDRSVSTRNLARQIGVRSVEPCRPEIANRMSGYLVGGTSPFATRRRMPVYMERSILELPRIFINGGRRGYLVSMAGAELERVLPITRVDAALAD